MCTSTVRVSAVHWIQQEVIRTTVRRACGTRHSRTNTSTTLESPTFVVNQSGERLAVCNLVRLNLGPCVMYRYTYAPCLPTLKMLLQTPTMRCCPQVRQHTQTACCLSPACQAWLQQHPRRTSATGHGQKPAPSPMHKRHEAMEDAFIYVFTNSGYEPSPAAVSITQLHTKQPPGPPVARA